MPYHGKRIPEKGCKSAKRAHQLLALAMEVQHFQSFLESNETIEKFARIEGEIFNLETNDSCDLNLLKEMHGIFKEFEEYQKKTEIRIQCKMAQYLLVWL